MRALVLSAVVLGVWAGSAEAMTLRGSTVFLEDAPARTRIDASGKVVGANTTVQRTLAAGEERAFTMEWPFPVPTAVNTEVIVTTNIFENANYIRTYGSQERFQGF